jgi:hypothetical protein
MLLYLQNSRVDMQLQALLSLLRYAHSHMTANERASALLLPALLLAHTLLGGTRAVM